MKYDSRFPEFAPVMFSKDVTTGAASVSFFGEAGAPVDFEILDVIVQPRGASTNGTLKAQANGADVTNAMLCATDKTLARAGTIDDAYSTVKQGSDITIVCAGDTIGNTKALVTVIGRRV